MRRLVVALALVAGVLAPAIGASAAPTSSGYPPGLGIRLLDAPVSLENDPRAHEYVIDRLAPGEQIQRHIMVSNGTASTMHATTYAAAATIGGGSFRPAAGHVQDEVSSWTRTAPTSLTLAPEQAEEVLVTIKVPADAAPGERYGVIWAQTIVPPATPHGIRQVARVGVRMYLSIGPGNAPAPNFRILSMTGDRTSDDLPVVHASVRNTGGRALDLTGTLSLVDVKDGLKAGPFPVKLGTTLGIGQTEPVEIVLGKQIPDGPWKATLMLQSDLTKRTAHATLTFPSGPGPGKTATATMEGGSGLGLAVWSAIGIAVLALLILVFVAWLRWRRKDDAAAA